MFAVISSQDHGRPQLTLQNKLGPLSIRLEGVRVFPANTLYLPTFMLPGQKLKLANPDQPPAYQENSVNGLKSRSRCGRTRVS